VLSQPVVEFVFAGLVAACCEEVAGIVSCHGVEVLEVPCRYRCHISEAGRGDLSFHHGDVDDSTSTCIVVKDDRFL
jgi:hypothetical protein